MTRAEALAEARKRWGSGAWARFSKTTNRPWKPMAMYQTFRVGVLHPGDKLGIGTTLGSGDSWEAAFADADKRGGK